MFLIDGECQKCKKVKELALSSRTAAYPRCGCGGRFHRVFTTVNTIIPPHMRAEADMDAGRARQKEWARSAEARALLDSGEARMGTKAEWEAGLSAPDALTKHRYEQEREAKRGKVIEECVDEAIKTYNECGKDLNKLNELTQKVRKENQQKLENNVQASPGKTKNRAVAR